MPKFKVTITETLSTDVEIEAEDECEALDKVRDLYCNSEIILVAENYKDTEFYAEKVVPESQKDEKIRKDYSR